ncbi:MAG: hypothetical protein NC218_03230 [Acetobacter sp.]|nr:hypothetical protein [Acetobacter sp.]
MNNLTIYTEGEKITAKELCEKFRAYNKGVGYAGDKRKPLEALVMLAQKCFRTELPPEHRLFHIKSNNKMFYSDTLGYSCFGHNEKYDERLENELDTGKGVEGIVVLAQ